MRACSATRWRANSGITIASAGELARAASVTPATASGHLGKLMAGKLPKAHCLQQGWLRRYEGERALSVTPMGRKHLAGLLPSVNGL